ncbi:MAG: hypothetical protein KDA70_14815 [Planctomycetaceae bacterium]|nr:hypothetical protein [Planctomycetaceae bacterium]
MKLLESCNPSVARILFLSLILGLNGCRTEQKEKGAGADEKPDSPPETPIDLSQMEWNDELAKYRGKPVSLVGTAQSSKASTRVNGVEIWSKEGYIWPDDVVGRTVKVVGILDYHNFDQERKRIKELESRVGKIQHRGFPEGVAGTYVIRGQYWCLQADVLPHTKRLFETDPLSDLEHKAVWGESLPANE